MRRAVYWQFASCVRRAVLLHFASCLSLSSSLNIRVDLFVLYIAGGLRVEPSNGQTSPHLISAVCVRRAVLLALRELCASRRSIGTPRIVCFAPFYWHSSFLVDAEGRVQWQRSDRV